VIIICITVGKI